MHIYICYQVNIWMHINECLVLEISLCYITWLGYMTWLGLSSIFVCTDWFLEIWLYYITWLGLSSILIYTYIVTMAMDGRLKASVVIHVVTMAMNGRLKASVVIWSVEAHESQEVDHVMRRGSEYLLSALSTIIPPTD